LPAQKESRDAVRVVQRVLDMLREPFQVGRRTWRITAASASAYCPRSVGG
jgi:hypothetical protein